MQGIGLVTPLLGSTWYVHTQYITLEYISKMPVTTTTKHNKVRIVFPSVIVHTQ